MQLHFTSRYTAFSGDRVLARGSYAEITQALAAACPTDTAVLVFDDATGASVDAPPRPEHAALWARNEAEPVPEPGVGDAPRRPAPGRPRLGVVAREVTLLPRHWDWLATQSGGASAALRRLVDQARKSNETADTLRQAQERSYKFMSAMAGHQPGFEEATRALFAQERERFEALIATWPIDVAEYARTLAAPIWPSDAALAQVLPSPQAGL